MIGQAPTKSLGRLVKCLFLYSILICAMVDYTSQNKDPRIDTSRKQNQGEDLNTIATDL